MSKIKDNYCFNKDSRLLINRKDHQNTVHCATILKNGKFATGSNDCSIIIYNDKTYEIDLIIKAHNGFVLCLIQLSSGVLVSTSADKAIKLFKPNTYQVIQTLTYHKIEFTK